MIAQRFRSAAFDVAARKAYRMIARELDAAHARAAVLYADHVAAFALRDVEPDGARFGVQPRVRLGTELAERAHAALAERKARRDRRIVKILRVAHVERFECRQYFGPSLFVQSARHEPDLYTVRFQFEQKVFKPRRRRERARFAAPFHDLVHFVVRVLEVQLARVGELLVRTVLVYAVLQMLRHRMSRNVRQVGFVEREAVVADERRYRFLDYPYPKLFASHACSVEIHQHGFDRLFQLGLAQRVVGWIAYRRMYVAQRGAFEADKLRFAVARRNHRTHAVLARFEYSVGAFPDVLQSAVGVEFAEIRYNEFFHVRSYF